MVKTYNKTPAELMNISDEYTAYCLNEAIAEYILRLEKGEKPRIYRERKNKSENPGLNKLLKLKQPQTRR